MCFVLFNQMSELNGQPVTSTDLCDAIDRAIVLGRSK
jgi:hypothetical protein